MAAWERCQSWCGPGGLEGNDRLARGAGLRSGRILSSDWGEAAGGARVDPCIPGQSEVEEQQEYSVLRTEY
jgi:hypothetical protein